MKKDKRPKLTYEWYMQNKPEIDRQHEEMMEQLRWRKTVQCFLIWAGAVALIFLLGYLLR